MSECRHSSNSNPNEAKKRGEKGKAPVHRFEQFIQQKRHDKICSACDDVRGETQAIQSLRGQDVARRSRSVAGNDDFPSDADLCKAAGQGRDQVEEAGEPCRTARPRLRASVLHACCTDPGKSLFRLGDVEKCLIGSVQALGRSPEGGPRRAEPPTRCRPALSHGRPRSLAPAQGCQSRGNLTGVGRQVSIVLYVVAMAAIIVGVDFMFFRNRFWERLIMNIGIVLVFAVFYLRFLRRP